MRTTIRRMLTAAVALTALATATACAESERESGSGSGESSSSSGGSEVDTFVFGGSADPDSLDPTFASDGETFRVSRQIFEGLVSTKPGTTELAPGLATKWDASEDGLSYTFTLQEGVTFSNGKPFDAADYDGPNYDNAATCRTKQDTSCVTLGIPPTADVTDPRWGLTDDESALAAAHVDGYVWVGRPWLYMQNDPFVMKAWGQSLHVPDGLQLLADGNGDLTRALGLEIDMSGSGMGLRSRRYALYAVDGVVQDIWVEAPGEFKVSSAEQVLQKIPA